MREYTPAWLTEEKRETARSLHVRSWNLLINSNLKRSSSFFFSLLLKFLLLIIWTVWNNPRSKKGQNMHAGRNFTTKLVSKFVLILVWVFIALLATRPRTDYNNLAYKIIINCQVTDLHWFSLIWHIILLVTPLTLPDFVIKCTYYPFIHFHN